VTVLFAFAAGVLSTLSPCVLPILPIILAAAATRHRWGAVFLAAGVALSFTAVGLFIATIGFEVGLDAGVFRTLAALVLIGFALVMIVPRLQSGFALAAGHMTSRINSLSYQPSGTGPLAQFGLGLTLGVVWSPCTGPTLGAASLLAAQGRALPQVALTMLAFGMGAALPLAAIGTVSRHLAARWHRSLLSLGSGGKVALGVIAGLSGLAILTGFDKPVETFLVNVSPNWLTNLTTRL
jgi:cytochrome c biogenesis protein CcdA